MITVYYSEIDATSDLWYHLGKQQLPSAMKARADRYYNEADRKLYVLGKILLLKQLQLHNLHETLFLGNIKISKFGKPFFEHAFDFNISHSGKVAMCAAVINDSIGADIEEIKDIQFDDFISVFSSNEWNVIHNYSNPMEKFFELWTKKEALVKAAGTGISILQEVEVLNNTTTISGKEYRIETINIIDKYKCSIAYTGREKQISTEKNAPHLFL